MISIVDTVLIQPFTLLYGFIPDKWLKKFNFWKSWFIYVWGRIFTVQFQEEVNKHADV